MIREEGEKTPCITRTRENKVCTRKVTIDNRCTFHHNKHLKELATLLSHDGESRECSSLHHNTTGSKYLREKVPIENFQNSPGKELYRMCLDCRQSRLNNRNNQKAIHLNNNKKNIDPHYSVCCSLIHEKISTFDRNKVPNSMFILKSKKISTICSDCRTRDKINQDKNIEKRKEKGKNLMDGTFLCTMCCNILETSKRSTNQDGTMGNSCINCKSRGKEHNKKLRRRMHDIFKNIQLEMINEAGCSCQRCKVILLKPAKGTEYQVELYTYMENEIRYVNYGGKRYQTKVFLKEFEDLLELRTIDLDHLSEKEQRERNIIGPNDSFIKKKGGVSSIFNEYYMREEAKITQNVCCKCHTIITISREIGGNIYNKDIVEKRNFVENLKRNSGCTICGFFDGNLLRYLEFDHLDPTLKIDKIANMVFKNYTIDQLIIECKKCRIICKACHRIHTDVQRKEGII